MKPATIVRYGLAARIILDEARSPDVAGIVMTTHGRFGLLRFASGSVAEEVLRRAPVPVFLLPSTAGAVPASGPRRILVPLDGSDLAYSVVGPVTELARNVQAAVILFRAYPTVGQLEGGRVEGVTVAQREPEAKQGYEYLQPIARRLEAQGISTMATVSLELISPTASVSEQQRP